MIKTYAILMSYQITDEEKKQAEKALRYFDYCLKTLKTAKEHLNLIYDPFKDAGSIEPDKLFERRAALRRYRDKIVENFNLFKKVAFKCYLIMQPFTSDTQTEKVLKSFVMSIEDIEKQVNKFVDLFTNLKAADFISKVLSLTDSIKEEASELEQIVEDRIKGHIQSNILARNWVDAVSEELQEKVEKKSPLIMELVEERQKLLENGGKPESNI